MTEKMKPSGIEWIGDIPSTWTTKRIKYVIQNNSDGIKVGPFGSSLTNEVVGLDEGEYKVYGQANLIRKDFSFGDNYVSGQNYHRLINYEVLPNDIAVSMMGTIGRCSVVPANIQPGIMDSHLIKIRLSSLMIPRFFEYIYESSVGYEQLVLNSKGSIMNGLNSTIVKSVVLSVPSPEEQQAIADYLDAQCAKIDSIAADLEKQIELLQKYKKSLITEKVTKGLDKSVPMKDSGIEWIGEIPETWDAKRMKFFLSVASGDAVTNEQLEDGDYPVFGGGKQMGCSNKANVDKDTILIGRVGANCGCVTITDKKAWATDNALVVKTNQHAKYTYYLLLAANLNQLNDANAQPLITGAKVGNCVVSFTNNLKEQSEISDYLDNECAKIGRIITEKKKQLETIQQHKKSLIYEYVTGKKRVKEAEQWRSKAAN